MPVPVPYWVGDTWANSKSLNLAAYTADGSGDNPTGIAALAYRPILFDSYTTAGTFPSLAGGSQSVMSTYAGSVSSCNVVLDSAGYYGQTQDLPGKGYYQYTSVITGSAGDGATPGGWMLLHTLMPMGTTATQTSVSADFTSSGGADITGTRQAPSAVNRSAPFCLDLQNVGAVTWRPAVTIRDSSAASAVNAVNTTDSSGETPRFYAIWAGVSATSSGVAEYTQGGVYPWTAPQGVTEVTAACIAGDSGGGAGNNSAGGIEYGGGGAGGAEYASDTVAVTPGNTYTVTVGSAGAEGTAPGGNGGAGGSSVFTGDAASVTAHSGGAGLGATTAGDGTGGAGGTGSTAATHHDGGAGNAGTTAQAGGGGGSSAGPSSAGNNATDGTGAPAVAGGGPGGDGGSTTVTVIQFANAQTNSGSTVTADFGAAIQAGNGVIVAAFASTGTGSPSVNVTLSDGTALSQNQSESLNGLSPNSAWVYSAWGVAGGETSVTFTIGASGQHIAIQAWEVSGMGPSVNTDLTAGNASPSGSANKKYTVSGNTNDAPELWFGMVADQATNGSTIYGPGSPWVSQTTGNTNHKIMSAWQWSTAAGAAKMSGSMSANANWGAILVTFVPGAVTDGAAPVIGPGGGGGGGLGASGNGGGGQDGQVILTWTGQSGGGYGTPAVPAPYASYSDVTTAGTSDAYDVNINTSVADTLNFLANPPMARVATTAGQSIASAALTQVTFTGSAADVDNYSGWSAATNTYTVQRAGLYLFHGLVAFSAAASGTRQAGVTVNGTTYWGPGSIPASSGETNVAKTQVFSLQAGDTVQLACRQDSGGAVTLSTTAQTRFLLKWLCLPGVPAQTWTPPDATFRWQSGTSGSVLPAQMQTHLGNDLSFLANPPFLMAWQSVAQSSLTVGSFSTVTLDMVSGIVHGDSGDNYAGWTPGPSNAYAAQQPGWYCCVMEAFAQSSAVTGATVAAGFAVSSSGGVSPSVATDYGQQLVSTSTSSVGGGAAALALVYLLPGETVTPQIMARSYASAYSTLEGASNSGQVNCHAEICWLSL